MRLLEVSQNIIRKFKEIEETLNSCNDTKQMIELSKNKSDIEDIYNKCVEYNVVLSSIKDMEGIVKANQDKELIEMVLMELPTSRDRLVAVEKELDLLMIPEDKDDKKNAILEIRAGTGGDEAALFAADLLYMYKRYCERVGLRFEISDQDATGIDGVKDVSVMIVGKGAYGKLRFESGTHRVQRIPKTENSGRIHTSAVTVAVLPEVDDIEIDIKETDLKIDVYRASGAGGQHVNKTDSAVRVTHLPTGIVVAMQEDRSQIKNRERAMKVLRSRIYELKTREQENAVSSMRKSQIGSGDRSEKIRTYNFPQNRITDHRINLTLHKLDYVIKEGDISELVSGMRMAFEAEKIEEMNSI